ncbi:AAA family ATPase [Alteromonas sp. LMIT006]|jgi:predicted ATP-dependent protease|uniref:Lon protease family protein n=1 Tax=Alteromonadaceae TaxID=72275 RepID=UPI0020CA68C4|nr:ATP-binding protein [Alteromonas sp. LMIT006]UTP72399.1 AAA family ATPase [Alteromonas sp. LMIT006]
MPQLSAAKSSAVIALEQSLRVDPNQCRVILSDNQIAQWRQAAPANSNEVRVFIGQERAKHALEFGLGMPVKGYNLYVMGEQATGRATLVKDYVAKHAVKAELFDWVYVNNVKAERSPKAIKMPAAQSERFSKDMQSLVNQLLDMFPAAFDNPGYQRKKSATQKHHQSQYEDALESVENQAQEHNIAMFEEDGLVSFMPIVEGKAINEETFATLDEPQQAYFLEHIAILEDALEEALIELPVWKRELAKALRKLKQETSQQAVKPLLAELAERYTHLPEVSNYILSLESHIIDSVLWLDELEEKEDKFDITQARDVLESQYLPNIIVQHTEDASPPLVYESNPTYQNLFGRIEYSTASGSVISDYRMISSGALHRANGGYLLLDADKMIEQPHVWESLKRALKQNVLRIDLPQKDAGMVSSVSLTPEPIPLQIKLILIGSRDLFYALQDIDEEFSHLFRVLVDFEYDMPAEDSNMVDFVQQVIAHAKKYNFTDVDTDALRGLILQSMRDAEHQNKISAQFADILELINEASFYARSELPCVLDRECLNQVQAARRYRTGRVPQSLLDDIKEGQIIIQTNGETVGTVNGLTVLDIGTTTFGTPARITATVYAGANGVTDIEREVELGQSIHSKGVMLLTGYLGHKYAQHFPLTLSANIALEQSYGYIDGDSASLGELVALISALTNLPCRQSLAITGSINQYGQVQSVGGINEKIEGFFALCQHRGLNGSHGVIIPYANQRHLILSDEVCQAIEAGDFHVYAVQTVDQALSLLMGKEAGEQNSKGRYPKGSINSLALSQLYSIANIVNGGDDE